MANLSGTTYRERIEALSATKAAFNKAKLERDGFHDTDDHGDIPWPEPIPFERVSNHPDGGSYGAACIGENFRRWLEVHPVYIHPQSALAGCWVGLVPGLRGWRPEDRAAHLMPTFAKYHILMPGIGGMNHLGPDMRIGLDLGWGGLLRKIRRYRALNRPADTSFYDAEENLVLGAQAWIRRHVDRARALAETERDPELRANYAAIADINAWLIDGAPRTLREACQFLAWFQALDRMWHLGGALGQLDELLRPYYEADLAAGLISDEEAIWYIASLFFNDTHYSQVGGPAPDSHDLTSPISFLILEAAHRIRIPSNLAVRVHERLDPRLLRRALEIHLEDGTGPSFSCSGGLDRGFARNGYPIELARMRAKVGCNWTALPGIEYCQQDVKRQCLVQPFLYAFFEMVDDPQAEKSLEALWGRYMDHLRLSTDVMKQGIDWHMAHQADNTIEIVLNLFCHGPIERGLDASDGGVDIYDIACDGLGLATVADSFAAIEQRVVVEKRLTWEQLAQHLRDDWEGAEATRLMCRNIPRFGVGGSRADAWAERLSQAYVELVRGTPTPNGYVVNPGLFSHGGIAQMGRDLGATPNGRHAGDPISHSANPDPGFAQNASAAPSAKANAVAAVQPGWGNSAPLQLDIDPQLLRERGGLEALEALIKVHNAQGGTLINLNVISKQEILEAHADPATHPDLMVRVTGYSAYFHSLSPIYRQQIVDRILAE